MDQLQPCIHSHFLVNIVNVVFYCFNGNVEFIFDLFVGFSFEHEIEYFLLSIGNIVFIKEAIHFGFRSQTEGQVFHSVPVP